MKLENLIGQGEALVQAKAYMEGQAMAPGAVFVGPIGVGKNSMALALADSYGLHGAEFFGTDCRGSEGSKILADIKTPALNGKKKMAIIKNAEYADEEFLFELLDVMVPKIFTINRLSDLHWKVSNTCQQVIFSYPSREDLIEYFRRIGKKHPGETVLSRMHSFTDALNFSLGGNANRPQILGELEEVRAIFGGKMLSEYRVKYHRLMEYYLYNGGNPMLATKLDLMRHNEREGDSLLILREQRLMGIINVPFRHYNSKFRRGVYIRILGFY